MATGAINLPPGFVLDDQPQQAQPQGMKLPAGFVLDSPASPQRNTAAEAEANQNLAVAQSNAAHPYATAFNNDIAPKLQDLATIPYHYANQMSYNNLRSLANGNNTPIPEDATHSGPFNPIINTANRAAGVVGAIQSPLNKIAMLKALSGGPLLQRMAAGGLSGLMYAPTQGEGDVTGRAINTAAGAVGTPIAEKTIRPMLENTVDTLGQKASDFVDKFLKPNKATVPNPQALQQYKDKAVEAFKILHNVKDDLKYTNANGEETIGHVPNTIPEAVQAIPQAKKMYWDTISDGIKQATGQDVHINVGDKINNEMDAVINNKAIQAAGGKDIIKHANDVKETFAGIENMTPSELQDAISLSNKFMSNFYPKNNMNLSATDIKKAFIDAKVAGILREALDNSMEKYAGGQFSTLKGNYGALRSVENELYQTMRRQAGTNQALSHYIDIFSGGDLVHGLLSGNYGLVGKGLGQRAMSMVNRLAKNPDVALQGLNKAVANYKNNPAGNRLTGIQGAVSEDLAKAGNERSIEQPQAPDVPQPKSRPRRPRNLNDLATDIPAPKPTTFGGSDPSQQATAERMLGNAGKASSAALATTATAGGLTALATKANASAVLKKKINDEDAIKTIIGEAENQGPAAMQDIASVIRNRGTLQGAYGLNSPRVTGHKYSQAIYNQAKAAWEASKTKNTSGGANHWFSAEDLKTPKVQRMIKNMQFIKKSGTQSLYKEGK